jgi:hypothetical protein
MMTAIAINGDWSRRFPARIVLADGRELVSLLDAGQYIMWLSASRQAGELLLAAERGSIVTRAEIAMRRALLQDRR